MVWRAALPECLRGTTDLVGDRDLDLAVANSSLNAVSILYGKGDESFGVVATAIGGAPSASDGNATVDPNPLRSDSMVVAPLSVGEVKSETTALLLSLLSAAGAIRSCNSASCTLQKGMPATGLVVKLRP